MLGMVRSCNDLTCWEKMEEREDRPERGLALATVQPLCYSVTCPSTLKKAQSPGVWQSGDMT